MDNVKHLDKLIGPAVQVLGLEYVGCEQHQNTVRIYIDKKEGVTIEDCERVSKQVGAVFDVENPIAGHYRLEVSSPGIERPLFHVADFRRFIGKQARITLKTPLAGRRKFTGRIVEVTDNELLLAMENEETVNLPFAGISKANLVGV